MSNGCGKLNDCILLLTIYPDISCANKVNAIQSNGVIIWHMFEQ